MRIVIAVLACAVAAVAADCGTYTTGKGDVYDLCVIPGARCP